MNNNNKLLKDTTIGMYLLKNVFNLNGKYNSEVLDIIDSLDEAIYAIHDFKLAEKWKKELRNLEPEYIKLYLSKIVEIIKSSPQDIAIISSISYACQQIRFSREPKINIVMLYLIGTLRKKYKIANNPDLFRKILFEIIELEKPNFGKMAIDLEDDYSEDEYYSEDNDLNSSSKVESKPTSKVRKPKTKTKSVSKTESSKERINDILKYISNIPEEEIEFLIEKDFTDLEIIIFYLTIPEINVDFAELARITNQDLNLVLKAYASLKAKFKIPAIDDDLNFNEIYLNYKDMEFNSFISAYYDFYKTLTKKEQSLIRRFFNDDRQNIWKNRCNLETIERKLLISKYQTASEQTKLDRKTMIEVYQKNKSYYTKIQQIIFEYSFMRTRNLKEVLDLGITEKLIDQETRYLRTKTEKIYYGVFLKLISSEQALAILSNDTNQFDEFQKELIKLYYQDGLTISQIGEKISMPTYKVNERLMNIKSKLKLFLFEIGDYCQIDDYSDLIIYLDDERYRLNSRIRSMIKNYVIDGMSYKELEEEYHLNNLQVSNYLGDGLRTLEFYKYGVYKKLLVPQKEFYELLPMYDEKEQKILEAKFIRDLEYAQIEKDFKISKHLIKKTISKFIIHYAKDKRNLVVNKEHALKEYERHISDQIVTDLELKVMTLYYGIKTKDNPDGIMYELKKIGLIVGEKQSTINKIFMNILEKLTLREMNAIDANFGIITREEWLEIIKDLRIPLNAQEIELIKYAKELEGYPYLTYAKLDEQFKKNNAWAIRAYKRACLAVRQYQEDNKGKKYLYEEDILPNLKYFHYEYRPMLEVFYKEKISAVELQKRFPDYSINMIRNILKNAKVMLASIETGHNYKKIDYDYLLEVINQEDLPLFGNVKLKKQIFILFYGLFGNKKHSINEIKKVFNLEISNTTIGQYITDVLLAIEKYKVGIKPKIIVKYSDVLEIYNEKKGKLSEATLKFIDRCLDELKNGAAKDDVIDWALIPKKIIYLIILKRDGNDIDIINMSQIEVLKLLKEGKTYLTSYEQESLKEHFDITERQLMSGKDINKALKLLSRCYIKELKPNTLVKA